MTACEDIIGKRYGSLVVIEREGTHVTSGGRKLTTWLCKCDCGNTTIVSRKKLQEGRRKSCGCNRYDRGFNEMREDGGQVYIKVNNIEVIVDKDDLLKFYPHRIHLDRDGYARTNNHMRLHRLIMNCPDGYEIDHINHNRTDNRKCNLRIVTHAENMKNMKPRIRVND